MPMVGLGQRFLNEGIYTPKPLIEINGKPMYLMALNSLNSVADEYDLNIVVRKEVDQNWNIVDLIRTHHPGARVIVLENQTRGAAETVLQALQKSHETSSILILDCDIFFENPDFISAIKRSLDSDDDGALATFPSRDPRFSYVRTTRNVASEIIEKVVISSQAVAGAYFFKNASNFQKYAEQIMMQGLTLENPEFYISRVVQSAIADGQKFRVYEGKFESFGTPEELQIFKSIRNLS